MHELKIILVVLAEGRGGVWRHVLDLADGFTEQGHGVTIASPDREVLRSDLADRNIGWMSVADSCAVSADIWHLHLHNTFAKAVPALLARRKAKRGPKIVLTEHLPRVAASDSSLPWDPTLPPGVKKPGARYAKTAMKRLEFALADQVIAVSQGSGDFLRQRYGYFKTPLRIVANGVPKLGAPTPPPQITPMPVVAIGATGWRKGFDVLIEAAGLAQETWHATVIGEGPQLDAYRAQAHRISGKATIEFVGFRASAQDAYKDAAVACMPSRSESAPYAAIEAMMHGRALVGTRVEGLSEFITDEVTGMLIEPDNAAQLAEALDAMARSHELCATYGAAAYEVAVDRFDVQTMITRTLQAYASAIGNQ